MAKNLADIRVLYVEDEDDVRQELCDYLKLQVKEVIQAKNGQEGLELFQSQKPDLIITDIKMPVMNGLDMIEKIRTLNSKIEVIITTAYNDKGFIVRATDLGVYKFLVKPLILTKLRAMMEESVFFMK